MLIGVPIAPFIAEDCNRSGFLRSALEYAQPSVLFLEFHAYARPTELKKKSGTSNHSQKSKTSRFTYEAPFGGDRMTMGETVLTPNRCTKCRPGWPHSKPC